MECRIYFVLLTINYNMKFDVNSIHTVLYMYIVTNVTIYVGKL